MRVATFRKFAAKHPTLFGIFTDKDDTLTPSTSHWAELFRRKFGITLDITNITGVTELYDLIPKGPRYAEMETWLTESFQRAESYHGLGVIDGVREAVAELRALGAEILACLTARREHLRPVTAAHAREILGETPVLMRPNRMRWGDTYQWKARIMARCWPFVKGIIEDNRKIIPALAEIEYPGTVWLYRSPPPKDCGTVRVVPCATHLDVVEDIREQIRRTR